jgi:hypothetical protein
MEKSTTTTSTIPTTVTQTDKPNDDTKLDCDFDAQNTCQWQQNDEITAFKWQLRQSNSPSVLTGPTADHTTGSPTGVYLHIDAATAQHPNQFALLISPYVYNSYECLTFYYHMYGCDVNTLSVQFQQDVSFKNAKADSDLLDVTNMWMRKGNKGNTWMLGYVRTTASPLYTIRYIFNATVSIIFSYYFYKRKNGQTNKICETQTKSTDNR